MIMSIKCKATGRYIKPLTKRQEEIYALVKQGKTDVEISHLIGISDRTVSQHICMICDKLKLSGRHELKTYQNGENID